MSGREALREQLSALMDGELSREESLFLLKRLEHDSELRDEWERLNQISAMQQGEFETPSAGFADRVMACVAAESLVVAPQQRRAAGMPRWVSTVAGGAVAAAVAYVALVNLAPTAAVVPASDAPLAAVDSGNRPGSAATGTMNLPAQIFAPAAQISGGSAQPVLNQVSLKLDSYLLRHSDALGVSAEQGFSPVVFDPYLYPVSFGDRASDGRR